MPTRREALLMGASGAVALTGCMETPEDDGNATDGDGEMDGNGTGGAGDGGDGEDGATDGDGEDGATDGDGSDDGGGATDGDVSASVSTEWDADESTITVTLDDMGDVDHVDVRFSGEATAVGRLNAEGDSVVLAYDGFRVTGQAENTGFQEDIGEITLPTWGSEVTVRATAVSGDASSTVLDETQYLGDQFVSAQVSHLFDDAEDAVRVVLTAMGTADRVEIQFRGDVFATGVLHELNDEIRLTSGGVETLGDAEATTEEGQFDGAQDGDQVRIKAIAIRMAPDGSRIAAQNIVTDKTGSV
jgi:hypothetical protein